MKMINPADNKPVKHSEIKIVAMVFSRTTDSGYPDWADELNNKKDSTSYDYLDDFVRAVCSLSMQDDEYLDLDVQLLKPNTHSIAQETFEIDEMKEAADFINSYLLGGKHEKQSKIS